MFPVIPNPTAAPPSPAVQPSVRVLFLEDLLFDYATGALVRTADGDLAMADGYRAWVQVWADWFLVQQASHPVYPRAYGIAHDTYAQAPTRAQVEALYTGRIRRRAAREPGTRTARGFKYTWGNDGTCTLEVEIVAVTGETVKMGVAISGY